MIWASIAFYLFFQDFSEKKIPFTLNVTKIIKVIFKTLSSSRFYSYAAVFVKIDLY